MDRFRKSAEQLRTYLANLIDRRVLIFGEEGFILVMTRARRVRLEASGMWDNPDDVKRLETCLKRRGQGAVVLMADLLEQYFRAENMPPVPLLDRRRVRRRKVAMAFDEQPHLGATWMRRRDGKPGAALLMASLGASDLVDRVFQLLDRCQCEAVGLGLLAVEGGETFNRTLRRSERDAGTVTEWRLLISRHAVSGLRQVVMRDNDLALTRLRRFREDGGGSIEAVAQELRSTIGYLSRLGMKGDSSLTVVLVGTQEEVDHLAAQRFPVDRWHAVQPEVFFQAANLSAHDPEGPRPEVAMIAEYLDRGRMRMPMTLGGRPLQEAIRVARFATIALAFALVGTAAWASVTALSLWDASSRVADLRKIEAQRSAQVGNLQRQVEEFEYAADDVDTVLRIHRELQQTQPDLLPVVEGVAAALGPNLRLTRVSLTRLPARANPDGTGGNQPQVEVLMQITFDGEADLESEIAATEGLAARLRDVFEDHRVVIRQRPLGASVEDLFAGTVDTSVEEAEPTTRAPNRRLAILSVTGPVPS